jgi:hypothetical protein
MSATSAANANGLSMVCESCKLKNCAKPQKSAIYREIFYLIFCAYWRTKKYLAAQQS